MAAPWATANSATQTKEVVKIIAGVAQMFN